MIENASYGILLGTGLLYYACFFCMKYTAGYTRLNGPSNSE